MKRRVLVLMLGMTMFLCATLSGCLGSSKTKSLDKYWDAQLWNIKKDETGKTIDAKVRILGLTEEGKKQTFLVLPKKIAGYDVASFLGTARVIFGSYYDFDFGKVKGIVFEDNPSVSSGQFSYTRFIDWMFFKYASGYIPVRQGAFFGQEIPQYPIIFPDSLDYDSMGRDINGRKLKDYEGMNYKHLSENIKEYKTEEGELWSKFTDETNLVFDDDVKLYKDELIIIASEEMESITFPKGLKNINKLRVIPSEKQPEGTKIAVNIPSTTTVDKDAFEGNSEIIEIVRY